MSKSNAGRIGVWGASGSGKSSYVKQQVAQVRRLIVFDPLGEYEATQVQTVEQVRAAMRASFGAFRLALHCRTGSEGAELSKLCRLLMAAQQPYKDSGGRRGAGLTLVVEEMNLSFPVSGGAARCPGFAEVCSRGRHYGIQVYGVSQRIAEVDTRFRGNCTETVVFRQKGQRDRAAAAAELGCSTGDLPSDNLQFVHEKAGLLTKGSVTFPAGRKSRSRTKTG
ncbi:ATP-binding protein [Ruegeria pomeroyi]|uniref:hypothetical protein n=1 Tax=Ruegeria pomeroyi TaxID=89184 RepID=UPI001F2D8C17|nr:hypothetical protein [Ruegeria pomeroyi]MCE8508341.1 ATP-binding protein [Ruegeria pomeroyi]